MKTRVVVFVLVMTVCVAGITIIFWQQELKYQLPTPIPTNYVVVKNGDAISLPPDFKQGASYFFHFYNPDCPCSRFNARHLKSLTRKYIDSVHIIIMVTNPHDVEKAKSELGEDLNFYVDTDGRVAKLCGVYSTPQAAIIDSNARLYYRGNYNASRYCTARATNFAELSLIALLNHQPSPLFGLLATQSYGCELTDQKATIELF